MPPREGADEGEMSWKTPDCHAILRLAGSNRTNQRRSNAEAAEEEVASVHRFASQMISAK